MRSARSSGRFGRSEERLLALRQRAVYFERQVQPNRLPPRSSSESTEAETGPIRTDEHLRTCIHEERVAKARASRDDALSHTHVGLATGCVHDEAILRQHVPVHGPFGLATVCDDPAIAAESHLLLWMSPSANSCRSMGWRASRAQAS